MTHLSHTLKSCATALMMVASVTSPVNGCSNAFINAGGYHVEARTLDFPINIAFKEGVGFINDTNTTDVILDHKKIPAKQLASWKNKYGYVGREAFSKIIDGMNTEGLTVSILYLPGTKFPVYTSNDKKPVLGIYDIGVFLLSQAKTVAEAVTLLRAHQLVQSAVAIPDTEGVFAKDIPIHYVVRDVTGESAVIEFIDGEVKIHENAGNVMTNAPVFEWQLENAAFYDSLKADNKGPNDEFRKTFHKYDEIYKSSSHKGEANLIGMPGDYTPPSRFARAQVLLNNFPSPTSREVALYQAETLNNSLSVPALKGSPPTIWSSIKDMDNKVYYTKNVVMYQGDKSLYAMDITSGYVGTDLKEINFNAHSPQYATTTTQVTPAKNVKEIITPKEMAGF